MIDANGRNAFLQTYSVSRETLSLLDQLVVILSEESARQNLMSPTSMSDLWSRHFLDSAQLIRFADRSSAWIDVGSGAGFPGLIIAIMTGSPVKLIEPRQLRARFLVEAVSKLMLTNVEVVAKRVETIRFGSTPVLTARALAPLDRMFGMLRHLADDRTMWILPKGRTAASELEAARKTWHGRFTMHSSITDPDATIIVARDVKLRSEASR